MAVSAYKSLQGLARRDLITLVFSPSVSFTEHSFLIAGSKIRGVDVEKINPKITKTLIKQGFQGISLSDSHSE